MPVTTRPPLPPIRRLPPEEAVHCEAELRWIGQHRDEYKGEWVALDGDRLLAHGTDGDNVFAAARAQVKTPFLHHFLDFPDDHGPSVGGFAILD